MGPTGSCTTSHTSGSKRHWNSPADSANSRACALKGRGWGRWGWGPPPWWDENVTSGWNIKFQTFFVGCFSFCEGRSDWLMNPLCLMVDWEPWCLKVMMMRRRISEAIKLEYLPNFLGIPLPGTSIHINIYIYIHRRRVRNRSEKSKQN